MDTFCSCLDWMLVIGCCLSFAFSYADPLSGRLMRCMLCVKQRLIQGPTKVMVQINQMHQGKVALATFFTPTTAENPTEGPTKSNGKKQDEKYGKASPQNNYSKYQRGSDQG